MAGSWGHLVHNEDCGEDSACRGLPVHDGAPYRDQDGAFPLAENMGDAVEALEECYGMVWALARRVLSDSGNPQTRENMLGVIENAHNGWRDGYELGAGEPPRW